jgi:D-lactate dehydrogenase (cytochrome)
VKNPSHSEIQHGKLTASQLAALVADLKAALGSKVSTSSSVRDHHGRDESYHAVAAPDVVVFAESTADVATILQIGRSHRAPIIPFGGGTSLEGHIAAVCGGISVDLTKMDKVLKVDSEDFTATVQPGVRRKQLNTFLRDTGLFFPIDPGADATLGGMAATRASGTNAVRYGTMRHNIVSLEVALIDGRVIRTARRAKKSAAGYDLTALFTGSEGTLGVITELTVRLYGIPEATASQVVVFEQISDAVTAVVVAIQSELRLARIEFLDARMMAAINSFSREAFPLKPSLFVEFTGTSEQVDADARRFAAIAEEGGGRVIRNATGQAERAALWEARHNALYAVKAQAARHEVLSTDVCVPLSRLADCLVETSADLERSRLQFAIVGHVGDGNFHALILVDPTRGDDIAEAGRLHEAMARRAIAMDGTCTGEHGIGLGKRGLLREELGEAVDVMRTLKTVLDPDNLLNPEKIFDQ